jgi:hypothetical protein
MEEHREDSTEKISLTRESDFNMCLLGTLDEIISENISSTNGEKICRLKLRLNFPYQKMIAEIWYTISKSVDYLIVQEGEPIGIEYNIWFGDEQNQGALIIESDLLIITLGKIERFNSERFFNHLDKTKNNERYWNREM